MTKRSVIGWIGLLMCLGCGPGYSENERLNYIDEARKIASDSRASLEYEAGFLFENPSSVVESLSGKVGTFKAKYQATPLDESFGLVEPVVSVGKSSRPYLEQPFEEGPHLSDEAWSKNRSAYEASIRVLEGKLESIEAK